MILESLNKIGKKINNATTALPLGGNIITASYYKQLFKERNPNIKRRFLIRNIVFSLLMAMGHGYQANMGVNALNKKMTSIQLKEKLTSLETRQVIILSYILVNLMVAISQLFLIKKSISSQRMFEELKKRKFFEESGISLDEKKIDTSRFTLFLIECLKTNGDNRDTLEFLIGRNELLKLVNLYKKMDSDGQKIKLDMTELNELLSKFKERYMYSSRKRAKELIEMDWTKHKRDKSVSVGDLVGILVTLFGQLLFLKVQ